MTKAVLKGSVAVFALGVSCQGVGHAQDSEVSAPLTAYNGEIGADYGALDAFWGSLDAFYGNLDAFYGDLGALYGSLDAFYGSLDAFYGSLDAFWGSLDAFYGSLDAFDDDELSSSASLDLRAVFSQAEASFGPAVTAKTGRSFHEEVVAPLLQKYGFDLKDYAEGEFESENASREDYARLLLELHDRVMTYTGIDHVDHWMGAINWSPKISQSANGGAGVVVGLLDTPITSGSLIGGSVNDTQGFGLSNVDHGAGVASILAGAHDGEGVMGVAPNADFLVYNPFNETFNATWEDVRTGVQELSFLSDASIINMSLGVEGWTFNPDWLRVFFDIRAGLGTIDTLVVKSAGNSGVSQSTDVNFGISDAFRRLIIVGSVDTNGEISDFSNRPGDACFIHWGQCREGNRLMDRFLVAPGELVLVQDNAGNLARASGTSLAAPQVAGAAALIQSRWEWMRDYAAETAEILLETATDLGDPGTDEVYGRGLLNVEAALAPIDANMLYIETAGGQININEVGGMSFDALGIVSGDTTITAFENIGWTRRDFEVPLSSLGLAMNAEAANPFSQSENYMAAQLNSTAEVETSKKKKKKKKKKKNKKKNRDRDNDLQFTNNLTLGSTGIGSEQSRWSATFTTNRRAPNEIVEADALPFQMTTTMVNNDTGLTLRFGEGQGALAFSGGSEFGLLSDHDLSTGGTNPLLGLASGGFFAGAEIPLSDRLSFDIGMTQDTDRRGTVDPVSNEWLETFAGLSDYEATAIDLKMGYGLSRFADVSVAYTQLHEATGLLSLQGIGALSFEGGATTDALTVGADASFDRGFSFSVTATGGQTRQTSFDQSVFAVSEEGIRTTAFQFAASKSGVFHGEDALRVSFAQPLHIEGGALTQTTLQVVDRSTGDAALVTDTLAIHGNERRFVSEVVYSTSVQDGDGSVSAFAQFDTDTRDMDGEGAALSLGIRFSTRF